MIIQMMSKMEPFHQKKKVFEMVRFTTISQWRKYKNTPEVAGKTIAFDVEVSEVRAKKIP